MAEDDPESPEAVADELYRVDPAEFVAGRDALVRRLRAEKRTDVARAVAKLRRPSPAAWAVNRLARDYADDVAALVRLGDDLRAAQARALGGAGGNELRHAAQARRDAVAALTGAAARLLAERGGGVDAHLPGVTATLDAASLDAAAGATVLAGRLSTELEAPSGFGGAAFELPDVVPPEPAPDAAEPAVEEPAAVKEAEAQEAEAEEAVAAARRRAEELAGAARAAVEEAAGRRRAVEEADAAVAARRRDLAEAERRRDEAVVGADEAERVARDAETAEREAAEALRGAERRLRDARGRR